MSSINELLSVRRSSILEDSNFYSARGIRQLDFRNSRNWLETLLEEGVTEGVSERLIRATNPVFAHMRVYELGCGLQILLPFDKKSGKLVTLDEIVVPDNTSPWGRLSYNSIKLDGLEYPKGIQIDWNNPDMETLKKILKENPDWCPVISRSIGRFEGRMLGEYVIESVGDTGEYFWNSAKKEVTKGDLTLVYNYRCGVNRDDLQRVADFDVGYAVKGKSNNPLADLMLHGAYSKTRGEYTISLSARRYGRTRYSSTQENKVTVSFDSNKGLIHYNLDNYPNDTGGGCMPQLDETNAQRILDYIRKEGGKIDMGQVIAALLIPNMTSPYQKVDYESTLIAILNAFQHPNKKALLEFRPVKFVQ